MEESYRKPSVTSTVILYDPKANKVALVQRGNAPYKGYFAFPGGFIDTGEETTEQAAIREVHEETNIDISDKTLRLIDVRSNIDRDPRDHVIDIGYLCTYSEIASSGTPGDDAVALLWVNTNTAKTMLLAFDHNDLLNSIYPEMK